MRFRVWLENKTIEIPLVDIITSKKALIQAFNDFKDGRESRTNGPIQVWKNGDKYQIIDGYHRFIAAIFSRNKTIKSEIIEQGHSSFIKPNDQFHYTPSLSYKDLEDLADRELINDLG